jgi:hypothetical protein
MDAQRTLTEGWCRSTRNPEKKGLFGLAMTTSSEDLVKLEEETTRTPRLSSHKARRRERLAVRIALILGLVIGVLAISDFVYNAYERADCYPAKVIMVGGVTMPPPRVRGGCSGEVVLREELLQLDSAAVVLAAALVTTSTVISRRIKRHPR